MRALNHLIHVLRDPVTALVFSILAFLASQSRALGPELSIIRLTTFELTALQKWTDGQMSICVGGTQPRSDAYFYGYEVRNDGGAPIRIDDYFEPISVHVPEGFTMNAIQSIAAEDSLPGVVIQQVDQKFAYIAPVLLNPGDVIRCS